MKTIRNNTGINKPHSKALASPALLTVTSGDAEGEVNLVWEPVRSAHTYVIQKCRDTKKTPKWMNEDIVPKSCYTVTGLKSMQKYLFRVAAVGKQGQGPWSEPVLKKVP